jgi:hypothetical protein
MKVTNKWSMAESMMVRYPGGIFCCPICSILLERVTMELTTTRGELYASTNRSMYEVQYSHPIGGTCSFDDATMNLSGWGHVTHLSHF